VSVDRSSFLRSPPLLQTADIYHLSLSTLLNPNIVMSLDYSTPARTR
jgi:hypothetical protein